MNHIPTPLYGVAISCLIFWCGVWCMHLLAICYGKFKLHKKLCKFPSETPLPPVSILKPLMGVDPNLEHNLETFFTMDYPVYELLFCVEDSSDPAIKLVESLLAKYPKVDATLFLGGINVGVNPKINNMQPGYLAAKYEFIMISDSGIKMKNDTLTDMVNNMSEKHALVHQMPFTCDREGFAATFEKIFFGTIQSRIYLTADLLGVNCHTGMSCLLRKSVLDEVGGLKAFGCYLAEDFFIAKAIVERGWKMRISNQPALQNSGICDIASFQARLIRWVKLRVAMVPTTILLEPLSECMILGALAAWSASLLFRWDPLVFYLVHVLTWFLSDWALLSIVQNGSLPFHKFEFVIGWLFRELSGPYLFLHALWNPAIRWRTRTYKLHWGGVAYELPSRATTTPTTNATIPITSGSYQQQQHSNYYHHYQHNQHQQHHHHHSKSTTAAIMPAAATAAAIAATGMSLVGGGGGGGIGSKTMSSSVSGSLSLSSSASSSSAAALAAAVMMDASAKRLLTS